MERKLSSNEIKASLTGFYHLINSVIDARSNNQTVKDAIGSTISFLQIEDDFYYDYESIDRLLLVNAFELCKSVFLTAYDKGTLSKGYEDQIIESFFQDSSIPKSDTIKVLRNCLAHDDYSYQGYMQISINSDWNSKEINISINIIDFYNYTHKHITSLWDIWQSNTEITSADDKRDIDNISEANLFIEDCLNNTKQSELKSYVKNVLVKNDDFKDLLSVLLDIGLPDLDKEILSELNSYVEIFRTNILHSLDTFETLFEFIESIRFHLNYDRQKCLENSYALISDNYFNYCIEYKKSGMYKPNFKEEWDEMNGIYKFYTNLDVKLNIEDELKTAVSNYSVFLYVKSLTNDRYFPYDKIKLIFPKNCTRQELIRHLRNSAIHRNYHLTGNELHFKDYNLKTGKLTFDGILNYMDLKNAILSNYHYVPYESPFY